MTLLCAAGVERSVPTGRTDRHSDDYGEDLSLGTYNIQINNLT